MAKVTVPAALYPRSSMRHATRSCYRIRVTSEVPFSDISLRVIIPAVQFSLRFSDAPLTVGYWQKFSVIRGLSLTRESEKGVFHEIVRMSVV